ncbi:cardiolipin synthase [Criibacterium bergeronii]|uniref:Cardiolipin synthase n=1 Tax=Criibacterium bergeronii TaxID=1871336 RepID=A0A371IKZ9_9FIRM|nr:cardiolipin synthase [Criibacterium bergeronii]MBS6062923.1 cardiolipin synthase [Peptostreptococcaceae bacterium]RDY21126.1 cardiolipin synthase [Criibacterium bergeronii]
MSNIKKYKVKLRKPDFSTPKKFSLKPILTTILLMILQIILIALVFIYLDEYLAAFGFILSIITFMLVVYIVTSPEKSGYKIAWILPIAVTPVFGLMLYAIIKIFPGTKKLSLRTEELMKQSSEHFPQNEELINEFDTVDENYSDLCKMLYSSGWYPLYKNIPCEYYSSGEVAFEEMKKQLRLAKEYIFIEFFIIKQGKMLAETLDILAEKAKEGLEVRFIFDGSNLINLPWDYDKFISKYGIKAKIFSKPTPILSSYQNNRDHRKIVVIDGRVAFTGGINLADEYINEVVRFGHWKDCAIKVEGEAVKTFVGTFLQMWNFYEKFNIKNDCDKFLSKEFTTVTKSDVKNFVVPYADYPDNYDNPGEAVYMHILYYAKKYVYIMSPYLVIDDDFLLAMKFAAKRGVKVRLIIPGIPDKKIPYTVAQSFLPDLIRSGVEVYIYAPGFVHSKIFISDDTVATVGTVNLDYRSMYLHFENGVLAYDKKLTAAIKADFESTLESCIKVYEEYYILEPFYKKFLGKVMRIFGPIM